MAYSETRYDRGAVYDTTGTGWFVGSIVALALVAVGYLVFSANDGPTFPPLTSAHVKIDMPAGHGSATHIGDGLYVTAAHVVDGNSELTINGEPIAVLWSNKEYDIALVRGSADAAFVPLACVTPNIGETGLAHGNPMSLEDITTSLTVAGEVRTIGEWKSAIPMDGTMGPGMSGGSFVIGGYVAGINVGVAMAPANGFPSFFGISIIVPASVVCDLLGRT